MQTRALAVASLALVLSGALAACGGGGSSGSTTTSGVGITLGTKPGGSTATTPSGSTSQGEKSGKVRVFNAFAQDGTTGVTLDIYDTASPGTDDKPLIKGLAYGELSDYVQPKGFGGSGNLYIFEAGKKQRSTAGDSQDINGQAVSNAGFDKGTQRTVVIGTTNAFDDDTKNAPLYSEIMESGTGNLAPPDSWKAVSGKGLLLVSAAGAGNERTKDSYYLAIDGSCPARRDPENSAGGPVESIANGNAVPYVVAPGSHELKLLVSKGNEGLTSCDLSASQASATVDVAADKRVEVFLTGIGDDPSSFSLVTAPVPGS